MQKLYCYVDETGQDTRGRFFLVAVVIADQALNELLKERLLEIEQAVSKTRARWAQNRLAVRIAYLEQILALPLERSVFYSIYEHTTDFTALTGQTVVKALRAKRGDTPYRANIELDGFNDAELAQVRGQLKAAQISYDKLRGPRDESLAFIRLADALAGFLRDCQEIQPYTKALLKRFEARQFFMRLP